MKRTQRQITIALAVVVSTACLMFWLCYPVALVVSTASPRNFYHSNGNKENPLEELFRKRRETVSRGCRKYFGYDAASKPFLDNVIPSNTLVSQRTVVVHKFSLTYCMIPKVASQNMRQLLLNWENINSNVNKSAFQDAITKMWLSKGSNSYKAKNYTKIIFVRNPLERLISAWRYMYGGKPLLEDTRRSWKSNKWMNTDLTDKMTLSQFFQFLADRDDNQRQDGDIHWLPIVELADPCRVNYDYIGHFEQLQQEVDYIVEKLTGKKRASADVPLPNSSSFAFHKSHISNGENGEKTQAIDNKTSLLNFYGNNVPAHLVRRVVERYKSDFEIFGYDIPNV